MVDTTLDFSIQDDIPLTNTNDPLLPKEGISLQELLEEFNKGDNPGPSGNTHPNPEQTPEANTFFVSPRSGTGRPSHRRIKMASMTAQTLHADILKEAKNTAETNDKINEYIKKRDSFASFRDPIVHKDGFLHPPSMEGSRKNSQNSIQITLSQDQTHMDAVAPMGGRRQGRSQTILVNNAEGDQRKVHLPKIGTENKLHLFKSNTETKVSLTESRVNLVIENRSLGFKSLGDRLFSSQISLSKMTSGTDLTEKRSGNSKISSAESETLNETPTPPKMKGESSPYLESTKSSESKESKVDLRPGRRIVFRKRSEPQLAVNKIAENY